MICLLAIQNKKKQKTLVNLDLEGMHFLTAFSQEATIIFWMIVAWNASFSFKIPHPITFFYSPYHLPSATYNVFEVRE